MDERQELMALLRALSYERRHVVLASGRESDFYVDGKQTTLHARGAMIIGSLVLTRMRSRGEPILGVGGLTMGADPIATAASVASAQDGGPLIHAFYVRKDAKGHGTRRWVEGRRNLPDGSPVVIVEDTSTTGTSAWNAVLRAREEGLDVREVITVVDREEGAREFIEGQGMGFFALVGRRELTGEAN